MIDGANRTSARKTRPGVDNTLNLVKGNSHGALLGRSEPKKNAYPAHSSLNSQFQTTAQVNGKAIKQAQRDFVNELKTASNVLKIKQIQKGVAPSYAMMADQFL